MAPDGKHAWSLKPLFVPAHGHDAVQGCCLTPIAAVQMDYVRQVQMEMMDDMLEKGTYENSKKYERDAFAGEGGENYAEDQPGLEESDPHRQRV